MGWPSRPVLDALVQEVALDDPLGQRTGEQEQVVGVDEAEEVRLGSLGVAVGALEVAADGL
eukprot:5466793-Alexandrium_andersonii.AAC.1